MRNSKYKNIKFKMIKDEDKITKHPGYKTYINIKQRCYNKNWPQYEYWGGKGIYMCEEWKNNSIKFLLWYEENYKKNYSIDRIDNNGPYSPDNCRFASPKEQADNRLKYSDKSPGVSFDKTKNKYVGRITLNKKSHTIGYYESFHEAKKERDMLIKLYNMKNENEFKNILINISKKRRNKMGFSFVKELNKWKSYIQKNGKQIVIGHYKNKNDAIKAREMALGELKLG